MYKKIVVGYDGEKFSQAALKEAMELAKSYNGQLFLVSAMERVLEMPPEHEATIAEQTRAKLDEAAARVKTAGIAGDAAFVVTDHAHEAIIATAIAKQADLIVLGTHGRNALMRLLMGSTTERVIGHAPCNVLVVRCPH